MSSSERHPDNSSHLMPVAPAPSKAPRGGISPRSTGSRPRCQQPAPRGGRESKQRKGFQKRSGCPYSCEKLFTCKTPTLLQGNASNTRTQLHSPSPSKVGRVQVCHHTPKPAPHTPPRTPHLPRQAPTFCLHGRIPGTSNSSICTARAWHCPEVGPHGFRP